MLVALIEANGAVVSKDELMTRVWPGRIVEDNNLHAQIKALRKAFAGYDVVRTVVGRGYQFTGDIHARGTIPGGPAGPAPTTGGPGPMAVRTNLPAPTADLIARDDEIGEVIVLVADHRFVTVTGAGGIGKTRLAVEARGLLPQLSSTKRKG